MLLLAVSIDPEAMGATTVWSCANPENTPDFATATVIEEADRSSCFDWPEHRDETTITNNIEGRLITGRKESITMHRQEMKQDFAFAGRRCQPIWKERENPSACAR